MNEETERLIDSIPDEPETPIPFPYGRWESLNNHPKDEVTGRFICTSDRPKPPDVGSTLWLHPDAKDTGKNDPYWDHYKCPNCNITFYIEVAE